MPPSLHRCAGGGWLHKEIGEEGLEVKQKRKKMRKERRVLVHTYTMNHGGDGLLSHQLKARKQVGVKRD